MLSRFKWHGSDLHLIINNKLGMWMTSYLIKVHIQSLQIEGNYFNIDEQILEGESVENLGDWTS